MAQYLYDILLWRTSQYIIHEQLHLNKSERKSTYVWSMYRCQQICQLMQVALDNGRMSQ